MTIHAVLSAAAPWHIETGDCLAVLRSMPDRCVQCCVTSPPYFGLRDYGTDGQIGLEKTPAEFVAKMVEVFAEVRRVLRDDGTCWLNLGSSYSGASDGSDPIPSPLLWRVPSCDTDGKAPLGSPISDRAYYGSDGESPGETQTHRDCTAHSGQSALRGEPQTLPTVRDSVHSDSSQASHAASLPGVPLSTTQQFCDQPSGASFPLGEASAFRRAPQTSPLDASLSSDKVSSTCGTLEKSQPLVVRTEGKESFFSACHRPTCKGVGKCGLCWCSLAIPSMQIKQKDLIPIPWMVAMALQADGWYLRSDIIWAKKNCMPESVTDRPTKAHEYLFLLAKSERYFYDAVAIKEGADPASQKRYMSGFSAYSGGSIETGNQTRGQQSAAVEWTGTRNRRSVWTIATQPFPGAHFATFPAALAEPCIMAGTGEAGCCADCGAPRTRVVERTGGDTEARLRPKHRQSDKSTLSLSGGSKAWAERGGKSTSTGWQATCDCNAATVPCVVLDPFSGAGTTAMVARRLGRRAIGIELNPVYADMGRARVANRNGVRGVKPLEGQRELFA